MKDSRPQPQTEVSNRLAKISAELDSQLAEISAKLDRMPSTLTLYVALAAMVAAIVVASVVIAARQ